MIMDNGSKIDAVAVLDYVVEGRQVVMTTEARGKQHVIQVQVLEGIRSKWATVLGML